MSSEFAIENKKGDVIRNDLKVINRYLDTIPDIKKLHYIVEIFESNPVDHAIVTVALQQGEESFKIRVFFSQPSLNHNSQIRNYDFEKTPKSYKIDHRIKIGGDGG